MTNCSPTIQLSAGLSVGVLLVVEMTMILFYDGMMTCGNKKLSITLPRLPCWGERLSKATEHWFNVQILLEILNWLSLLGKGKGKDNH